MAALKPSIKVKSNWMSYLSYLESIAVSNFAIARFSADGEQKNARKKSGSVTCSVFLFPLARAKKLE